MWRKWSTGFLLATFLFGQPPQAPDLVIRSNTRLVTLDVVVTAKDGKAAADLSASDFTILDNGKRQELRVFRGPNEAAAQNEATGASERMKLPAELPASVFTNFNRGSAMPPAVTVILFDGLNTNIVDQRYARSQILKFLGQVKPNDRIGVYVLGQKLHVLHDFTSDAASVVRQLNAYGGELMTNTATESSLAPLLSDNMLQRILTDGEDQARAESQIVADQNVAVRKMLNRVETTYKTLEAIAQHLAPIPGRKNLVWVSAAFPHVVSTDVRTGTGSPETFAYLADRAIRAITSAGVAVYPIDARGVMVDLMYSGDKSYREYAMAQVIGQSRSRGAKKGPRSTFSSPDSLAYAGRDETRTHYDTMNELAERTGGRAFYNKNDNARSIREAIDDKAGTYVLGYYPSDYEDNGRFRRVQVKVTKPGLSARHREGYFANESKTARDQQQREAMWDLMASPLNVQAIPFAAQVAAQGEGNNRRYRISLRFDPAAVSLREEKGRWLGELNLVMLYLDEKANSKGGAEQWINLDLSATERERAMEAGYNYEIALPASASASRLLIGVRDSASGRAGTLQIDKSKLP
jgi:VWFA-related protein